jgi:hypothetical protein
MNAVERIFQYSHEGSIAQEAAYEGGPPDVVVAPEEWPSRGQIDFNDVVMWYVRQSPRPECLLMRICL